MAIRMGRIKKKPAATALACAVAVSRGRAVSFQYDKISCKGSGSAVNRPLRFVTIVKVMPFSSWHVADSRPRHKMKFLVAKGKYLLFSAVHVEESKRHQ